MLFIIKKKLILYAFKMYVSKVLAMESGRRKEVSVEHVSFSAKDIWSLIKNCRLSKNSIFGRRNVFGV